jgi:hypothetical protein
MTARQLIVPGAMPSLDANGRVLPAKFRFYLPSSGGAPTSVYTDNTLTIAHPFPILSDSGGRWPAIWADDTLTFDVGWSDQVFDEVIKVFSGIAPAADAVLASASIAAAAAGEATSAAATAVLSASEAAASAMAAAATAGGLKVVATSSSANTIGAGVHVFVLNQAGTNFAIGMDVQASDVTDPTNRMVGTITAFADPSMTISVPAGATSGAGTLGSWSISLSAIGGVMSVAGLTGIITAAQAKAALATASADITDFEDAVVGLVLSSQL